MNSNPVSLSPWWLTIIFGRNPRLTLIRILVIVGVSFFLFRYLLLPMRVEGISMEPTYRHGRFNFVNTLAYVWSAPKRGDVVAIEISGRKVMFLKRIIALPGERITIHRKTVSINGIKIEEPYVKHRIPWPHEEHTLLPDEYFVLGDNRAAFPQEKGKVDRNIIIGKVLF